MACRYKENLGGMEKKQMPVRLKIPIDRLPKPPLPPTRPVRIGEVVSASEAAHLSAEIGEWKKDNKAFRESARRGRLHSLHKAGIKPWTAEEEQKVLALRAEGKTVSDIATIIGRTPSGVEHRLGLMRRRQCK